MDNFEILIDMLEQPCICYIIGDLTMKGEFDFEMFKKGVSASLPLMLSNSDFRKHIEDNKDRCCESIDACLKVFKEFKGKSKNYLNPIAK